MKMLSIQFSFVTVGVAFLLWSWAWHLMGTFYHTIFYFFCEVTTLFTGSLNFSSSRRFFSIFFVALFLTLAKSSWTTFLCQFRCENIVVTMMKFSIAFRSNIHSNSLGHSSIQHLPFAIRPFAIRPGTATIWRKAFIFVRFKSACEINFNGQ